MACSNLLAAVGQNHATGIDAHVFASGNSKRIAGQPLAIRSFLIGLPVRAERGSASLRLKSDGVAHTDAYVLRGFVPERGDRFTIVTPTPRRPIISASQKREWCHLKDVCRSQTH
jgi:hypothetical protein